jgi:hypothetical protein
LDIVCARYKVAAESILGDNVGIYEKLSLVLEPAVDRCIIASEKIPKGDIIIPPISPQVSVYIGKLPDGYLDLDETFTYAKCDEDGNIKTARLVMLSKMPQPYKYAKVTGTSGKDTQEFIAAFWLVKCTEDPEAANCTIQFRAVNVVGKTVTLPVLVNTKAVKSGEKLITYKPHDTTNKFPVVDASKPAVKKQRTS